MADLASVKNNVRKIISNEFGNVSEDKDGSFFIRNESAVAFVDIVDWELDNQNVGRIVVYAVVASGMKEINKDLAVELVTDLSRTFGSWFFVKLDAGGYNLIFQTDLIAATVDAPELINAIRIVAIVANVEDDKIVRKYGGSVFIAD
jgi:hypothetical protein